MSNATDPQPLYIHTVARSYTPAAWGRWAYWTVARYEARPRKSDGQLTWRRVEDLTPGYRSPAKAVRESGLDAARIVPHIRQGTKVRIP